MGDDGGVAAVDGAVSTLDALTDDKVNLLRTCEVRQGAHAHVRRQRRRSDASGLDQPRAAKPHRAKAVDTAKPGARTESIDDEPRGITQRASHLIASNIVRTSVAGEPCAVARQSQDRAPRLR